MIRSYEQWKKCFTMPPTIDDIDYLENLRKACERINATTWAYYTAQLIKELQDSEK